jgi:hypothetical protein
MRERGLRQHRDRPLDVGQDGVDIFVVLDEADRLGRDRERSDGLVVTGVTDVQDREALPGPDARLSR